MKKICARSNVETSDFESRGSQEQRVVSPSHKTAPVTAETRGEQYGFAAVSLNKLKRATGPLLYKYLKKIQILQDI